MVRAIVTACICLLVFGTPLAAPAFALCEDYSDAQEAGAISKLAWTLQLSTAWRDRELVAHTQIQLIDAPGEFGLYAEKREDGGYLISVPRGFMRLNCQLILTMVATGEVAHLRPIAAGIDRCLTRFGREGLTRCLSEELDRGWPAISRLIDAWPADRRLLVDAFPQSTLEYLLLHEFGHIALGHLRDEVSATPRDEEFHADVYASRYINLVYGNVGGAPLHFGFFGLLRSSELSGQSTHDSFLCRLENLVTIDMTIGGIPSLLMIFPADPDIVWRVDRNTVAAERRVELRKVVAADSQLQASDFSTSCRISDLTDILEIRPDLLRLARFQDGIADHLPGSDDGAGVARVLDGLIKLDIKTADGRAHRNRLIAALLRSYPASQSNQNVTALLVKLLTDDAAIDDGITRDVGSLHQELGKRIFYYPPDGEALPYKMIAAFLHDGIRSGPYDAESWAAAMRLELREKNCAKARPMFELGFGPSFQGLFDIRMRETLRRELAGAGC